MTQTVDLHNPRFIRERGLEVLTKELGCVGTVYFLRQFSAGKGNWTAERKTPAYAGMEAAGASTFAFRITSQYENKSKAVRARYYKINDWQSAGLRKQSYVDTSLAFFAAPFCFRQTNRTRQPDLRG